MISHFKAAAKEYKVWMIGCLMSQCWRKIELTVPRVWGPAPVSRQHSPPDAIKDHESFLKAGSSAGCYLAWIWICLAAPLFLFLSFSTLFFSRAVHWKTFSSAVLSWEGSGAWLAYATRVPHSKDTKILSPSSCDLANQEFAVQADFLQITLKLWLLWHLNMTNTMKY